MITAIRNFLNRRRTEQAGPWCSCFEDRGDPEDGGPYGLNDGMHCLLEPRNAAGRPVEPVRCQGTGCWTS